MTTVDSLLLFRAVKNASLFCRRKSDNGGEVRFHARSGRLAVESCDDFIGVQTIIPARTEGETVFFRQYDEIRQLLKALTSDDEYTFTTTLEHTGKSNDITWWDGYLPTFAEAQESVIDGIDAWELNPERLALLNRLEPKGLFPLSWKASGSLLNPLWVMKYGPDCRLVLAPLEREGLNPEWVW